MAAQSPKRKFMEPWQGGMLVFVLFCGLPALEMNGFGFGIRMSLAVALVCSIIGGAIGGALICPRPLIAGVIGGLVAGPVGLLAVYYYSQHREQLHTIEIALVQCVASLPGVGVGIALKLARSRPSPPS